MIRDIHGTQSRRQGGDLRARWKQVIYDVTGIDRDIERLIDVLRERRGISREEASVELLHQLSVATP